MVQHDRVNSAQLSKSEKHEWLIAQYKALIQGENDKEANAANLCALVKEVFGWHWVGFYWVKNEELVLGCFQGPVACTRIAKGKGVCGTAWALNKVMIVPNVHEFDGHIACSSLSNSELVIPIIEKGKVTGVFDIDSIHYNDFDETDAEAISKILQMFVLGSK